MSEKKSLMSHLHDLKLWQKSHEKSPKKKKFSISDDSLNSNQCEQEYNDSSGSASFDCVVQLNESNAKNNPLENFEEKLLNSPPKTFKQLLEEKLQHDAAQIGSTKTYPKRPFLKKGSGLERYGLKPGRRLVFVNRKEESCSSLKQLNYERSAGDWSPSKKLPGENLQKSASTVVNTCISIPIKSVDEPSDWYKKLNQSEDTNDTIKTNKSATSLEDYINQQSNGCGDEVVKIITPLKMPTANMDVKAKWFKVAEGSNEKNCYYENFCEVLNTDRSFNTAENSLQYESQIRGKINEYAQIETACNSPNPSILNSPTSTYSESNNQIGEQTLYENALEKELRVFELLEEKVQENSFCSTNSSVIQILNSTSPRRVQLPSSLDHQMQTEESEDNLIEQIQKLINHSVLKKPDEQKSTQTSGQDEIVLQLKQFLADKMPTIFENESHESTNDTTSFQSMNCSENQVLSNQPSIVNCHETNRKHSLMYEKESFCNHLMDGEGSEELNKKLTELNQEIITFRENNCHIQEITKRLKEESAKFQKEMSKVKQEFTAEKMEFYQELEEQRKKLKEEKFLQDRCSKKEREELNNLKLELEDVKETLKLKETKSGTSLARLRTHIKQLETENANLKEENNKLRQTNAKLLATQKLKDNQRDTKIMNQISKKLDKLAPETGKQVKSADGKKKIKTNKSRKDSVQEIFWFDSTSETKLDKSNNNEKNEDGSLLEMYDDMKNGYYKQFDDQVKSFKEKIDKNGDSKACDCKTVILQDGSKEFHYDNGNFKQVSADGNKMILKYHNGDIKETNLLEGIIKYTYNSNNTVHTIFSDGTEILEFPNGQVEKTYKDGKKEIKFANNINKIIYPDKHEELFYPDGTKIVLKPDGDKILFLVNGQKEYHTAQEKRREYPDGSVKILHNDGRQETRYANGRIRIKDKDGNLILDTHKSPD